MSNSTFMGLSIASRGLYTAQASLSVASNNISNMNTAGYTRQTVNQTAAGPAAVYSSTVSIGAGSQINSIDQIREASLDKKYWRENGKVGEWEVKANTLTELESIMGETSENGLSAVMDDFYSALEDLAEDPSSNSARTVVREAGNSVCQYLNDAAQKLADLRSDLNGEVKTEVDSLNSYAQQIADLNQRIRVAAASKADVNELTDQRNLLIDKLSKLAEVEVTTSDNMVSININGNALVSGVKARQLEVYEISDGSTQDGMYGIRWSDTKASFDPGTGEIKAYLDVRDGTGTNSEYKGIPYYSAQLDDYARTFAEAFNEGVYKAETSTYSGHAGGVAADGTTTGVRFFSFDDTSSTDIADLIAAAAADAAAADPAADAAAINKIACDTVYAKITAGNISLSSDIVDSVSNIAAASSSGEAGNNENIAGLISICEDSKMFNTGTPGDFINSIVSTLGSDSSYAQRRSDSYSNLLDNITNRRSSVSGVSTNEETADLTKYQQAYEASAKMISVWDEIYKETINLASD